MDNEQPTESEVAAPARPRIRRIPLRFVLPNLVTLLALCLGLTAIRLASEGLYELAVVSIVGAAILDGLDGRIARALKGASRFGAELDSLADFVDFGVAPALLLYFWALHENKSFGWFAALLFAVACALRFLAEAHPAIHALGRWPALAAHADRCEALWHLKKQFWGRLLQQKSVALEVMLQVKLIWVSEQTLLMPTRNWLKKPSIS